MHLSTLRRRLTVNAAVAGVLLVGLLGSAPATLAYEPATPMVVQEVPVWDLEKNTNGICTSGATHVIKNAAQTFNAANYLEKAQACGLKVIFAFPETINYATGAIYPSRIARWVNKVKNHPATFGYISVKEPSWSRISAREIRTMYRAFRAADPKHPVIALFGDMPGFGTSRNPYTAGMANIVMFDWYPVETTNGTNSIYLTGATKWFPRAKNIVNRATPGKPVWLMVQTHKYLRPATHKKQRPTEAQLFRQVRDGLNLLGAKGIAFHVWRNVNYARDGLRDPAMVASMAKLFAQVKDGSFR
ncbi:MAG TPA: hypothetical protein VES19_00475 [Candidatus Limnocylindrales bacterium]|nr:hypothetical protein [Candidatus Limnocylindrales bacterium]